MKDHCFRYDIDWLIKEIASGKTFKYETFWHETAEHENHLFSQWASTPFTYNGRKYLTAEQYMMSEKALLFNDMSSYSLIMNEPDPRECKALGKLVKGFDQPVWDKAFREIIFHGNIAKVKGCPDFLKALLATGDAILIEASPTDDVYGAGMDRDALLDSSGNLKVLPQDWHKKSSDRQSQNNLGFVLMGVRDLLRDSMN